ncbi:MAG: rhodanese-like domain-containing protein [Crocinitomicaceae bacterium]|nr:rhodanese-like domain-containing protein [Crocinitomicaceae bacterium]
MFKNLFKKTDYKQLFNDGAVVIDVRSPQEYAGGAIPGSENIHWALFRQKSNKSNHWKFRLFAFALLE